jgi:hypothetical protein
MVKFIPFILKADSNYLIKYAALFVKVKKLSYIVTNNLMYKAPVVDCTKLLSACKESFKEREITIVKQDMSDCVVLSAGRFETR